MNHKPFLLAAALAACAAATAQPVGVPAAGAMRARLPVSDVPAHVAAFAEAMGLYRAGRWSAAYGRLVLLADSGHVDAARILIVMLRYGRELHGTEWTASPSQVRAWERMVRSDGPLQLVVLGE